LGSVLPIVSARSVSGWEMGEYLEVILPKVPSELLSNLVAY
jgi:hypothetical protein